MSVTAKDVKSITAGRLYRMLNGSNEPRQKAALANLRRGIGKAPGELPELWGEFLADMPEEMFGKGEPSAAEWAVYTALTVFALHQQGHDPKTEPMHREGRGIGRAARLLVESDNDEERIRNRFNIIATSADMRELTNHLRALVSLLKAKGIPMDYAALAADLYMYQFPAARSNVRLRWGQDFYGFTERKDENNDK
jgi:CRISPR system Cascade subunit CasB